MKNLKPILLLLTASVLFFTFCSCGSKRKSVTKSDRNFTYKSDVNSTKKNDVSINQEVNTQTTSNTSSTEQGKITQTNTTKFNTVFDSDGKPHAVATESTTTTTSNYNNNHKGNRIQNVDSKTDIKDNSESKLNDNSKSKGNNRSQSEVKEPKPPNWKNELVKYFVALLTILCSGAFFYFYLFRRNERN